MRAARSSRFHPQSTVKLFRNTCGRPNFFATWFVNAVRVCSVHSWERVHHQPPATNTVLPHRSSWLSGHGSCSEAVSGTLVELLPEELCTAHAGHRAHDAVWLCCLTLPFRAVCWLQFPMAADSELGLGRGLLDQHPVASWSCWREWGPGCKHRPWPLWSGGGGCVPGASCLCCWIVGAATMVSSCGTDARARVN